MTKDLLLIIFLTSSWHQSLEWIFLESFFVVSSAFLQNYVLRFPAISNRSLPAMVNKYTPSLYRLIPAYSLFERLYQP